jgi:alpha-amylase
MSRANLILDTPIAPGKVKPMVEVLPNGIPSQIVSQDSGYVKPFMKWFSIPIAAVFSVGLISAVLDASAADLGVATPAVPAAVDGIARPAGQLSSIADLKQFDPNHPGLVKPDSDLHNAPKWYQDSVFYHIWLDGFADSDGDGYGDLAGVLNHLDYLNDGKADSKTSLGVNALWLSPFFDANSRHHYDAKSFYKVDSRLGDMDLLKTLLQRAHQRGMRVIFDMVPNHSSSRHPYFLNSRSATNALLRDFYVWTDSPPQGMRNWTRTENGYYYDEFGRGMPDFNYLNPQVVAEMENVMRFYFNLGFDGVRLDAVRYLVEEGDQTADTQGTHQILKEICKMAKAYSGDRYLVGEAWASNDIMKTYYGNGDELTACFNFSFTGSVANSIERADGDPLDDNISYFCHNLPQGFVPANFLVNHDSAGARSMTRYDQDLRKIRLAAALNLLEWGIPYVYYGEEIGMEGQNGSDQNMRRPFIWKNAEDLAKDPQSLLSWHRNIIRARLGNVALRHGDYRRIATGDQQVYAFVRSTPEQKVLCLFNLNTKEAKQLILNLAPEFSRFAYPIVGRNGKGPTSAYKLTMQPGEVTVLSLDVKAKKVCDIPEL